MDESDQLAEDERAESRHQPHDEGEERHADQPESGCANAPTSQLRPLSSSDAGRQRQVVDIIRHDYFSRA